MVPPELPIHCAPRNRLRCLLEGSPNVRGGGSPMGPGEPADQPFDLRDVLAERGAERYELHRRYLNPQLPRMLHAIGFDKVYTRARGRLPLRRRRRRVPRHAGRLRRVRPRPPPPGRPAGAARRPRRRPGRPDPVRRPAAGRPARRGAARQGPAPRPGVLRQQRHRGGRGRPEVRPLRHRPPPHPVLRPRLPRADHRVAVGQRRAASSARASARCCPTPRSRSATCAALRARAARAATSPAS